LLNASDVLAVSQLRNIQARAQEHDVSMGEIERENLRRVLSEPIPPEYDD
jgi:hypothetical protein